jgi:photosynthetic reaction center cytochrome c subunit
MNRRLMVLGGATVLACCAFVGDGARAQSGPAAAPATEKKAEQQFKNIQTLKGIPADQLIPTMQFIAASLGVECEFCHVQNAFDKDDKKPKQTARKMMEMMFAINADNFDRHREVTCYTCHRGSADPVAIPAVMTEAEAMSGPKKPEQENAHENSGPSGDQLIDKFVQASGGAAAIGKVTSRAMKGKIEIGAMSLPIDVYTKDPDKRVSFTHMQDGDNITAFDGHEGWMGAPNRPVREMHGSDIDGASIDADLQLPVHLKQMFTDLKVRGTEKIGDHDAYVVVGQREGKPPIRLFFDEQSGLLVRMLRFGDTALGLMPTQIDYADYRDASGVKIPYRWTLARPSGRFTIEISEVQTNVPVDDAKFAKPPSPPEPPKGPAK